MVEYRELFEKIPDGITVHDAVDGSFVDTNHQFCEMLGYTRAELLEKEFGEIHVDEPPYTTERAEQYIQRAATEGPQTFEWLDETKDGEEVPVEVHLRQTTIDGEKRVLAVVRDISERKQRESELDRIRDQMEFALDVTDTIIWSLDLETGASREIGPIERLFGTEPAGMGDFLTDVLHPDDRDDVERVYDAVRNGDADVFDVEFRVKNGEPDETWIDSQGYVQDLDTRDGPKLIGIATDVTEQKQRQRDLEAKNRRLEKFAGVVSHDLRNPLNVAEQRLALAREECESVHLDNVEAAHERMRELIEDILTLAREGEMSMDLEEIDLAAIVEGCWESLQSANATLEVDVDHTIRGDRNRLQQLLENLLRNAVEHGGEGVTVHVGDLDDGFFVADSGPGIPEAERSKVLAPGYSSDGSGTGFGLQIVREIVDAHGWEVRITESEMGGARFEISDVVVM